MPGSLPSAEVREMVLNRRVLVHKGGPGWFQIRTEWWDSLPNLSLRKPAEQQVAILPHLRLFRNVVLFGPWLAMSVWLLFSGVSVQQVHLRRRSIRFQARLPKQGP